MKREVENYIKANMNRALMLWNRALEKYDAGEMQSAASFYGDAMRLYYVCVQDLISGTGFVEQESEVK